MNASNPTRPAQSKVKMSTCKANESLQTKSREPLPICELLVTVNTVYHVNFIYDEYLCCFNCTHMSFVIAWAGALPRIHGGNTTPQPYGLLVFGWNFQLSTIEPLKFSASQKLLKNKCNKALAFCLGIWQAQGFHKMVGLFSIGQRKGQTWESTISMDLRIQSSLSRISQNHFDLQVLIFYHSCSLLLWENQILLLILIPWFSLKSPDVSKLRVWPFRKGRSPFFAGPLLSISVSQFWAQRNRTQSNRVIREGDRRLKVKQNPQRNPVDMGKYPIIYMVYHGNFIHSRWLFGISCINSMVFSQNDAWPAVLLDICPDRLESVPLVLWTGPW